MSFKLTNVSVRRYKGLELNDEMVVYDTMPKTLAEARINFESYLGTGA